MSTENNNSESSLLSSTDLSFTQSNNDNNSDIQYLKIQANGEKEVISADYFTYTSSAKDMELNSSIVIVEKNERTSSPVIPVQQKFQMQSKQQVQEEAKWSYESRPYFTFEEYMGKDNFLTIEKSILFARVTILFPLSHYIFYPFSIPLTNEAEIKYSEIYKKVKSIKAHFLLRDVTGKEIVVTQDPVEYSLEPIYIFDKDIFEKFEFPIELRWEEHRV